jgi:glycerol-3-phosphate dehydrogenase
MKRDLVNLTKKSYDLLVIGGGIHGVCVAWDACLRGLSVALVEKEDFGASTSANSLKVIHGGLRYLQHGDLRRMRQSILERKALLRIAPHLIHPLPVLVPTYGHSLKGREALTIALKINDLISVDRNYNLPDLQKHIPNGKIISRQACLDLIPGISTNGLNGGALFCDAQVYNSERLLLEFLHSATERGVDAANYVKVTGFLREDDRVTGVMVNDELTNQTFDIRAQTIINTSGPWVGTVLGMTQTDSRLACQPLAKAINIVTRSLFDHGYAVGLSSQKAYHDQDALISKGSRFFFFAPWRGKSLVGTAYIPYTGQPDDLEVTDAEIAEFLAEVNQVYPAANLTLNDVDFIHQGLLPSTGTNPRTGDVQLTKHFHLHDHCQEGAAGLLSVVGVKYTTARGVAEQAVNCVFRQRGETPPPSQSRYIPLHGGNISDFQAFLHQAKKTWSPQLPEATIQQLVYNYGSAYMDVLAYLDRAIAQSESTKSGMYDPQAVLQAEVRYGVHHEMAQTLSDVALRRTELGTAGLPNLNLLTLCAETMARELNWSLTRMNQELEQTSQRLIPSFSENSVTACL